MRVPNDHQLRVARTLVDREQAYLRAVEVWKRNNQSLNYPLHDGPAHMRLVKLGRNMDAAEGAMDEAREELYELCHNDGLCVGSALALAYARVLRRGERDDIASNMIGGTNDGS